MNNQHAPESSERREGERLQINLPMELGNGRGNGRTRDVSASGIYFETEALMAAGAPIRFSLVLEHLYPIPLRLECEGQIIRVERREGTLGVAAAINSYRLIPQEQHLGLWNERIDDDRPRQDRRPERRPDPSQDLTLAGGEEIEVGDGYSTWFAAWALANNGTPTRHLVIDPSPRFSRLPANVVHLRGRVEEISAKCFEDLH